MANFTFKSNQYHFDILGSAGWSGGNAKTGMPNFSQSAARSNFFHKLELNFLQTASMLLIGRKIHKGADKRSLQWQGYRIIQQKQG